MIEKKFAEILEKKNDLPYGHEDKNIIKWPLLKAYIQCVNLNRHKWINDIRKLQKIIQNGFTW